MTPEFATSKHARISESSLSSLSIECPIKQTYKSEKPTESFHNLRINFFREAVGVGGGGGGVRKDERVDAVRTQAESSGNVVITKGICKMNFSYASERRCC